MMGIERNGRVMNNMGNKKRKGTSEKNVKETEKESKISWWIFLPIIIGDPNFLKCERSSVNFDPISPPLLIWMILLDI